MAPVELMAGFDIFALASHKEAAGTVFLEAAYVGVPIVATRVGGVPEMVVDGSNAILTRLGDNAALTGALRLLVDDPERQPADGPRRVGLDAQRAPLHPRRPRRDHRTLLPPVAEGAGTWLMPEPYRC